MLFTNLLPTKPFTSRKARLYQESRVDFYTSRNKLLSSKGIYDILKRDVHQISYSLKQIGIENIPFGISKRRLVKIKGKPNYVQHKVPTSHTLQTVFYREYLYGIKCILQFHFYKDQFFYGQIEFRSSESGFTDSLLQIINEKYKVEHLTDRPIVDPYNNQVIFKNDINPSLSYLSGDELIKESIRNELNQKESAYQRNTSYQFAHIIDLI